MVLDYLGKSVDYTALLKTLQIKSIGALRQNITRLERYGVSVTYGESDLHSIAQHLQRAHPVIAFVDTAELPYWHYGCNHAVVIVGFGDDIVILNDPAFADATQHVSAGDFELAWLNSDNVCAVITTE